MERRYTIALFILSNIISVACSEYIDPKKIFFTFDNDSLNDNDDSTAGKEHQHEGPTNEKQNDNCIHVEKYKKCLSDKKLICQQYFEFLAVIDKHADHQASRQVLTFDISLSRSDLFAIKNVLRNRNCPDDTSFIITKFQSHYSWKMRLLDILADFITKHRMLIGMVSVTLIIFLLLMYWVYISRSWIHGVAKMVVLFFIGSVVETSIRKYQEQLAENKAKLVNGIPLSCRPEDQGYFYPIVFFFKRHFSVMEDDCVEYYKAEMIEPMLKTTIIEIVTETFSRWFLTPLPIIFEYIGNSIVTFFRLLPAYLWIPFILLIYVSIILSMFLAKGYRIRTLFFTIEPGNQVTIMAPVAAPEAPSITPAPVDSRTGLGSNLKRSILGLFRNRIEDLPCPNCTENRKENVTRAIKDTENSQENVKSSIKDTENSQENVKINDGETKDLPNESLVDTSATELSTFKRSCRPNKCEVKEDPAVHLGSAKLLEDGDHSPLIDLNSEYCSSSPSTSYIAKGSLPVGRECRLHQPTGKMNKEFVSDCECTDRFVENLGDGDKNM